MILSGYTWMEQAKAFVDTVENAISTESHLYLGKRIATYPGQFKGSCGKSDIGNGGIRKPDGGNGGIT